ncbi:DUF1579 domain-containing protein [Arthrobacter sp. CDRTa11]|uniref:DUF1579 family protein n=1 Tax=Arthrobacter sp. CDRTa11 TaxID=2651199 RepID=UPI002265F609|nr:DUF1579 family protein [Arthrobacter sp. CDRTa11]UZX02555.1 DUF1579 domain-containing protein [Arthrobacter sp. CDRTa11]
MNRPLPGTVHTVLDSFLGHWRGTTRLAAGAWGPEHIADAEVRYTRAAGGYAVVQSYRHKEADGSHYEGHGVFTVDPDHEAVLWYYVDSMAGASQGLPARCTCIDGVLRVERHSDRETARHTFRVDGSILTHTVELRLGDAGGFSPFMSSEFRRVSP